MMSFRGGRLEQFAIPQSSSWLMSDVDVSMGRQQPYTRQAPQVLKALREMALIQSTESSNRIEGVTVAPGRLRPLVLGNTRPRDRSEGEILGYRRALNLIHTNPAKLSVTPETLGMLHKIESIGRGPGTRWRKRG